MKAIDEITDERQHNTPAARQLAREAAAELAQLRAVNEQLELEKGVMVGEINKCRAENEQLIQMCDSVPDGKFVREFERLRAELDEAKRAVDEAREILECVSDDNGNYSRSASEWLTARPKEQE